MLFVLDSVKRFEYVRMDALTCGSGWWGDEFESVSASDPFGDILVEGMWYVAAFGEMEKAAVRAVFAFEAFDGAVLADADCSAWLGGMLEWCEAIGYGGTWFCPYEHPFVLVG